MPGLIRDSCIASNGVYGRLRVFTDLREAGEVCSRHRVARIMSNKRIKAFRDCTAPRPIGGQLSIIAPTYLKREFAVTRPDRA